MDEPFTCPHCHATISAADAWWDELRSSGQCPACSHARQLRRRIQRLLIGAAALVILPIGGCYLNATRPWDKNLRLIRQPRASIQAALLKEAPLGTSLADVQALVARHQWRVDPGGGNGGSIQLKLGEYGSFMLSTGVWATWTFDASGHLIELEVEKELDGP